MKNVEIKLRPAELHNAVALRQAVERQAKVAPAQIGDLIVQRRSIDARGQHPVFRLRVAVVPPGETLVGEATIKSTYRDVSEAPPVIIVGCGPAGMFAALEMLELGLKPIILERGKDVRARRRDLRAIQQFGEVNTDSNYCFGEG
ncbi:MAG: FAD-binding protein, partial [Bacteroidota bacterium]